MIVAGFDLYCCRAHCGGCYSFPILVNTKPPQLLPISASSTKLKLVVRLSLFPVHEIYSFHAQGKVLLFQNDGYLKSIPGRGFLVDIYHFLVPINREAYIRVWQFGDEQ